MRITGTVGVAVSPPKVSSGVTLSSIEDRVRRVSNDLRELADRIFGGIPEDPATSPDGNIIETIFRLLDEADRSVAQLQEL